MSYNNLVPFNFVLSSKHPRAPLTTVLSLPDSSCLPVPPGLFLSRVIESFSAPQPHSLTPTPPISLHKRLVLGSAHPKQGRGYHLNQRVIFLSALHFSDIPEWQTQVYLGHVLRNNPRKHRTQHSSTHPVLLLTEALGKSALCSAAAVFRDNFWLLPSRTVQAVLTW